MPSSTNSNFFIRVAASKDGQRWDTYVLNHPEATPYHLFAWNSAVTESYGHRCYYLYAEKNGLFAGVLPLVHIRLPGIVNELSSLPYCDVGNCLCDNEQIQDALLIEALKLQRMLQVKKMQLRGSLKKTELKDVFFHAEITGKVRMLLDLPPSSNELFSGFKSKLRSQIRKAEKNNITFCWSGLEELNKIYSVFSRNMHELGSPVHAENWFKNVLTHYSQRVKVGLAIFEEKPVGMGIILLGRHSVSIPWASTLRAYNHLGPNMLLYWNFLKFSADNGFNIFDFGRSTKDEGSYMFKKQWGAVSEPLTWYTNREVHESHVHVSRYSGMRELVSSMWRKIPLPVANSLGPHMRKYISL